MDFYIDDVRGMRERGGPRIIPGFFLDDRKNGITLYQGESRGAGVLRSMVRRVFSLHIRLPGEVSRKQSGA